MFLSRKRIRRLLDTVNQTQRVNKKRKRGLKHVNRTLRHKKPLNLRKRTFRHRNKKYKRGGSKSEDGLAMEIKLDNEKNARVAKDDRIKKEKELDTSEVYEYKIDVAGLKKLNDQIKKLEALVKGIKSASEEATQRLTIITEVLKNLIDNKKDNTRDKSWKKDINYEIKRMGGLKADLQSIIKKYEIIVKSYENDVENLEKYRDKKIFYEYTEPKSRITFYAANTEDFSKRYDKRNGVNLIFPIYASEPFFIEQEYIGNDMIKQIQYEFKIKKGYLWTNNTNVSTKMMDMINNYNTTPGELVKNNEDLVIAQNSIEAGETANTEDGTASGVSQEDAAKTAWEIAKQKNLSNETKEGLQQEADDERKDEEEQKILAGAQKPNSQKPDDERKDEEEQKILADTQMGGSVVLTTAANTNKDDVNIEIVRAEAAIIERDDAEATRKQQLQEGRDDAKTKLLRPTGTTFLVDFHNKQIEALSTIIRTANDLNFNDNNTSVTDSKPDGIKNGVTTQDNGAKEKEDRLTERLTERMAALKKPSKPSP